jgi:hypothetical protein
MTESQYYSAVMAIAIECNTTYLEEGMEAASTLQRKCERALARKSGAARVNIEDDVYEAMEEL